MMHRCMHRWLPFIVSERLRIARRDRVVSKSLSLSWKQGMNRVCSNLMSFADDVGQVRVRAVEDEGDESWVSLIFSR